jgi:hypothetical protein
MVAAKTVLDVAAAAHDNFDEYPILQKVMSQIASRQANASCIWDSSTPDILPADKQLLVDLHDRAQNLQASQSFKIGVLALLSGQSLPENALPTIEDYLFGHLWLALQQEDPTQSIQLIGKSIKKYGPDYFAAENDTSGGWGYALPLLASQQFKTALAYLAEAGGSTGLLQATHLGLIFSLQGVPVTDLGRPTSTSNNVDVVTALLVKYAQALEVEASPFASLEYLLKIPNKKKGRDQISSLLLRQSSQIDALAGTLSEEGTRLQQSVLDRYLPQDQVSLILAESADMVKRQSHDRTKADLAAKLFMLAGRYGSLLIFLNELVSPTDVDNEDKRYVQGNSCCILRIIVS